MNVCDVLLVCMLASYSIAIYTVWKNKKKCQSISRVLLAEDVWIKVVLGILFMGVFSLMYESYRENLYSFYSIFFLLLGLFGLLAFPVDTHTQVHYAWAGLSFVAIVVWSWCAAPHRAYAYAQVVAALFVVITLVVESVDSYFLLAQVIFVGLFAWTFGVAHLSLRKYGSKTSA